jgi:E3 ubiquitin-protein ligase RNF14
MVIDDGTMPETTPSEFSNDHSMAPPIPEQPQEFSISSLPPLLLHLTLPPTYPLHLPPDIVSLRATHSWLSRLPELQAMLLRMWEAGEGVLYNWVELIRTAEFLNSLDLDLDNIIRCVPPAEEPPIVR